MATITTNTTETIEFRDARAPLTKDSSFVAAQLGEWEFDDNRSESGIVIDSVGADIVVLSANNARKLAKWLNRAADQLDELAGTKTPKKRQHYEQDDDDSYGLRLDK